MAEITVAPGVEYDTSIFWGVTGLAGTIGIRLLDGNGGTAVARVTAGIREFPAGSGRYEYTRAAAPGTAGGYQEFWDDGDSGPAHVANGDSVQVTSDATAVIGSSGSLYVSRDELKTILKIQNESFADEAIDIAVSCASRVCDSYKGTRFYPTTETRYYSVRRGDTDLPIEDANAITEVLVDRNGDGSYAEEWTAGTEYWLDAPNSPLQGQPYRKITLRTQAGHTFPYYARAVKVTGSFGWAETPIEVKQAAIFIANDFLYRMREAPMGVLVSASADAIAQARLGRINGAAAFLLDNLQGASTPLLV